MYTGILWPQRLLGPRNYARRKIFRAGIFVHRTHCLPHASPVQLQHFSRIPIDLRHYDWYHPISGVNSSEAHFHRVPRIVLSALFTRLSRLLTQPYCILMATTWRSSHCNGTNNGHSNSRIKDLVAFSLEISYVNNHCLCVVCISSHPDRSNHAQLFICL